MESFQLLDYIWEGKLEPASPPSQDSSFAEELILEDYDFCNDGLFNNALFDIVVETKPVVTSDLMKDTPMVITVPPVEKVEKDQWLGQKLKMPQQLAGGYVPAVLAAEIGPYHPQPAKVQNTEELLMEFDCVYENVELTHLTPPQTPPQEACFAAAEHQRSHPQSLFAAVTAAPPSQVPTVVDEYYGFGNPMMVNTVVVPQAVIAQDSSTLQQVPGEYQLASSFGFQPVVDDENIARNLELVEEIVRSRSKDLPDACDEEDEDSCSFSEAGSVTSSSSPLSDSGSSSYCGSAYSRDQDDEWSPARSSSSGNRRNGTGKTSGGGVGKKRTRPYGRGVEDKKSRKKEQNKNAATRYRQKKKAEIEEILIVENELKEKNEELKTKSADIGREIRYLKSLMREVCKAKGLL